MPIIHTDFNKNEIPMEYRRKTQKSKGLRWCFFAFFVEFRQEPTKEMKIPLKKVSAFIKQPQGIGIIPLEK